MSPGYAVASKIAIHLNTSLKIDIVNLTIDCSLNHHVLALPADSALAYLLSKAHVRPLGLPLEAVICAQHGLAAKPDYPIAALAANADGLEVGDDYWLRADPVHLLLQRDSFSLSEPVPLNVERAHADLVMASLNQHFYQDGMTFCIGRSGAWYLRLTALPEIQTTLPAVAMDRNIYQFMPQGAAASVWLAYMNEIQMLLHEHPVNNEREALHQAAINSVWFSGGGYMTQQLPFKNGLDCFLAESPLYHGLAKWSNLPILPVEQRMTKNLQHVDARQHVRMELPARHLSDDASFDVLRQALAARQIQQLTINLGCYEKTLIATLRPIDIYKFWRKSKPIGAYLT